MGFSPTTHEKAVELKSVCSWSSQTSSPFVNIDGSRPGNDSWGFPGLDLVAMVPWSVRQGGGTAGEVRQLSSAVHNSTVRAVIAMPSPLRAGTVASGVLCLFVDCLGLRSFA